ncbi:MAG: hypothetical protein A2374_05335 [Candidatus Moranbacteria bacterium RIFOXYB1_FULL_44_23]|nr:MAG: hypothetical protein A2194_03895 [Candidatus Moranbacteria bacterium RIFOXYA1_FULL_44_8]OGI36941.1 MAG: hypothetical protein A2407_04580 [Candidatus Moranbacteria bacterium RIFOXYC1_FULL_44_8]OGI40183.1 MAG: hypothetical protein A2374_05335 [Candidatus Moranbacteria bacterium RIFOXYB1_FULL_44_23]HBB37250.1 hypothetical protein [Candidatus Moranbacteria bacterium]HBU25182.1 hypothetical protein [Candidatus Moranbacteria bacterium]
MKHRKTGCCQTFFFPLFIQPPAPFEGGKPFFRIERAERRYTGALASLRLELHSSPAIAGTPGSFANFRSPENGLLIEMKYKPCLKHIIDKELLQAL